MVVWKEEQIKEGTIRQKVIERKRLKLLKSLIVIHC
jgi:hypothetical protein